MSRHGSTARPLDKDEIKRHVSIEQVLVHYGRTPVAGKKMQCLFPEHHNNHDADPSMNVFEDRVFCRSQQCFGDQGADIFAVVGRKEGISDFPEQMAKMVEMFNLKGKTEKRTITQVYEYRDENGVLLFQTVRYIPKDFKQRRPDGKGEWIWNLQEIQPVLYRLPEVVVADWVVIFEGEKDADAAYQLGLPLGYAATTSPMGAGKWKQEYSETLKGKGVVICPDKDPPGQKHGKQIAQALAGVAREVIWLDLPSGKDVSEWIESTGATYEDFKELLGSAKLVQKEEATDKAQKDESQTFAVLTSAAMVKPQQVDWLINGRIPLAAVSVVAGHPGLGKSAVGVEWSSRASRGQLDGDLQGTPVRVVIASAEDTPEHTIIPRLRAAGADLAMVDILTMRREGSDDAVTLPDDLEAVYEKMKSSGARVLIIDPISCFINSALNSWKDTDLRQALTPLATMAQELDMAVVLIAHLNKANYNEIQHRVSGSPALVASARSVLMVCEDPEDEEMRLLCHVKSNLAPKAIPVRFRVEPRIIEFAGTQIDTNGIVWLGDAPEANVYEALNPNRNPEEQSQVEEAMAWLEGYLGDQLLNKKDIVSEAKKLGFSDATLRRAKTGLGVEAHKSGFGKEGVWSWKLPAKVLKGAKKNPKGDQSFQDEHLNRSGCKKNNFPNNLIKGAQARKNEHLSKNDEHLSESHTNALGDWPDTSRTEEGLDLPTGGGDLFGQKEGDELHVDV